MEGQDTPGPELVDVVIHEGHPHALMIDAQSKKDLTAIAADLGISYETYIEAVTKRLYDRLTGAGQ